MSTDLNCIVNLGSYIKKKNQLVNLFIQNQKELDVLSELYKMYNSDMESEIKELEKVVEILKENTLKRYQTMVAHLT